MYRDDNLTPNEIKRESERLYKIAKNRKKLQNSLEDLINKIKKRPLKKDILLGNDIVGPYERYPRFNSYSMLPHEVTEYTGPTKPRYKLNRCGRIIETAYIKSERNFVKHELKPDKFCGTVPVFLIEETIAKIEKRLKKFNVEKK